jgi:histone H3/H4
VPLYNHRESWAIETRSPKTREPIENPEGESLSASKTNPPSGTSVRQKSLSEREKFILGLDDPDEITDEREQNMSEGTTEKEILVVASKLKNYIRGKSGMNTSAAVVDVLSDKVRELCDQAVESAKRDGRKTVMDRDFS